MDPSMLTVYTSPFPKIRLGKDYDGGYIIADAPIHYTTFLSGGIDTDISFEEDFMKRYSVPCFAFDGTIDRLPKESNVVFTKKNIGFENTEHLTNLHDLSTDRTFVKMDIEGGEFDWLKSLSDQQLNQIDQFVMEFHTPFDEDVFSKINKNHFLIHFHGNNCCGVRTHKGVAIPNVFECTYLHKKYFAKVVRLNSEAIPSKLDMKNTENEEIYINYPPFVHKNRRVCNYLG